MNFKSQYYEGKALKETPSHYVTKSSFTYRNNEPDALWQDVNGKEDQGANREEVEAIKTELQQIFDWAKRILEMTERLGLLQFLLLMGNKISIYYKWLKE